MHPPSSSGHHGNVSRAQAVIGCDIQRVPGWDGGVRATPPPKGEQPPRAMPKTWGPLRSVRGLSTKPSGPLGDGVLWGHVVAQAGPWLCCGEGEEGEALWGDNSSSDTVIL